MKRVQKMIFKVIGTAILFFAFTLSAYGITVGAFYYPWYRPSNFQLDVTVRALPSIGAYDTSDPSIASKHLDQAVYAGIDMFFLEWTGPNPSDTGRTETEYDIDNGFLPALNSKPYVQYCMFYDQAIRMKMKWELDIPDSFNFNDPNVYNTFISDIDHIRLKYFGDGKYFRMDGRPVVWFYLERIFTGAWRSAINTVRNNANGIIYLIADELWNTLDPEVRQGRWRYFDAISCYGIGIDPTHYSDGANVRTVADLAVPVYENWQQWVIYTRNFWGYYLQFFWPLESQYDDDHISGRPWY